MNPAFLVHGNATPPKPPTLLHAGSVAALFENDSGFLRRIAHQGIEVIRGVYGAVRDHNWGTVAPHLENLEVSQHEDAFEVRFEARCRAQPIDYAWRGHITGTRDGTITYAFDGEARSHFFRNRIGLCLLHPLHGCVGKPCEVGSVEDTEISSEFPVHIPPHQPFRNVRALRHSIRPGLQAEVIFTGEVFETEDQRNWTDASFKTYGTPLSIPFPVKVNPGDRVQQTVTLRFLEDQRGATIITTPTDSPAAVTIVLSDHPPLPHPSLGLGLPEIDADPSERQLGWLRELQPGHLRTEVRFTHGPWRERLRQADRQAAALGTTLHLALHLGNDAPTDLEELARVQDTLQTSPSLLLAFQVGHRCTPPPILNTVLTWAQQTVPGVPVAVGTNGFFAELNRERPPEGVQALPCFSLSPQVHAFDSLSLIENLEAQPQVVDGAHAFAQHAVVVSPITLRMRWNPSATDTAPPLDAGELPPEVDPRQLSLFGAVWTLGSLATLLPHPHVHALTYYETVGWRGLMERETGSPLPQHFPSQAGQPFPLYYVFRDLAGTQPQPPLRISHPNRIAAIQLTTQTGTSRLLLANLTPQTQTTRVANSNNLGTARVMDAGTAANLTPETRLSGTRSLPRSTPANRLASFTLPPYAYARIDFDSSK